MNVADRTIGPWLNRLLPTWVLPDHLTVLRAVCAVPVILFKDSPALAVGWTLFSSACDISDGILARARGITTESGAKLDAACDKIFIISTLWGACLHRLPLWIPISVTGIDLLLWGMRPLKDHYGATSRSNRFGAAKTWAQAFGLCFLFTRQPRLVQLAPWAFVIALGLAFLSLGGHVQDIVEHLRKPPPEAP
jgi:phosphatidylglycerophosphate synthase